MTLHRHQTAAQLAALVVLPVTIMCAFASAARADEGASGRSLPPPVIRPCPPRQEPGSPIPAAAPAPASPPTTPSTPPASAPPPQPPLPSQAPTPLELRPYEAPLPPPSPPAFDGSRPETAGGPCSDLSEQRTPANANRPVYTLQQTISAAEAARVEQWSVYDQASRTGAGPRTFARRWFSTPLLDSLPARGAALSRASAGGLLQERQGFAPSIAALSPRAPESVSPEAPAVGGFGSIHGGPLARNMPEVTFASAARPQGYGWRRQDATLAKAPAAPFSEEIRIAGVSIPWYAQVQSDTIFGGSTANDKELQVLQRGGGEPKERGFFQKTIGLGAGLDFFDEYLGGDVLVSNYFDRGASDLKQARIESGSLYSEPAKGFALEAGQFNLPFGIENFYHRAAWLWLDAPIVRTRLLGQTGLSSLGAHVAWHDVATRTRLHLSALDAFPSASNMDLWGFRDGFGGSDKETQLWPQVENKGERFSDVIWSGRVAHAERLGPRAALQVGASAAWGPNASGKDGHTLLYGADAAVSVAAPNGEGIETLFAAELMARQVHMDDYFEASTDPMLPDKTLSARDLDDWGFYAHVIHAFSSQLAGGLRYDFASGGGQAVSGFDATNAPIFRPRDDDPLRHDRQRISALVLFDIPFSGKVASDARPALRLTLEYSYDTADFLRHGAAHTLWLGFGAIAGTSSAPSPSQ